MEAGFFEPETDESETAVPEVCCVTDWRPATSDNFFAASLGANAVGTLATLRSAEVITSPGATSRVTVTTLTVDFSRRAPCACVHRKPEKPTVTTATAIATPATAASLRSLRVPPAAGPRCLRAVEAPAVDVVLWPPCAGLGAAAGICVDVVAPMAASCAMARSSSWPSACLRPRSRSTLRMRPESMAVRISDSTWAISALISSWVLFFISMIPSWDLGVP